MIHIKSKREIELMRKTCRFAAETLAYLEQFVIAKANTDYINSMAHEYIISRKGIPAPLNYHGFPKSICTSKNEVICHGIPSRKDKLANGDILNIDVTTILDGFHGDTNKTYYVGKASEESKKLVTAAYDCMLAGIKTVRPGSFLGDIGEAIEGLAHDLGYSVVEDYCGHGIGREFHEEPQILHYGKKGTGIELRPGMTFTIEPMINIGLKDCKLLKDGWTVITKDQSLSAQFEHTILVTEDNDIGYEILTALPEELEALALSV